MTVMIIYSQSYIQASLFTEGQRNIRQIDFRKKDDMFYKNGKITPICLF